VNDTFGEDKLLVC